MFKLVTDNTSDLPKEYLQENNIQNVEEMIEDKIYLTDTECNFVSVAEKLLGDNKIGEKIQKAEYLQITT